MTEIHHIIGEIATIGLVIFGSGLLVLALIGGVCLLLDYFYPLK